MKKNKQNSLYIFAGLGIGVIIIAVLAFAGITGEGTSKENVQQTAEETGEVVLLGLNNQGYSPSVITLKAGEPVTLKNDGTLGGCGLYPIQPELGLNANFAKSNMYTFTPTKKGSFAYSCSMGMFKGTINVV